MKRRVFALILPAILGLAACAPDSREMGSVPVTTYEPPSPTVSYEGGYKIARGATTLQDLKVVYEPIAKGMALRGKIQYIPLRNKPSQTIDVDLSGVLKEGTGNVHLKNNSKDALPDGLKLAAKATCLSAKGTCHSSFIDIYLYSDGVVYHHQVEANMDPQEEKEEVQSEAVADHGHESEGESDVVDGIPGPYVGSVQEDIQILLDIKPEEKTPEVKKEEEVKKAPRTDQAVGSVNAGRLENAVDLVHLQKSQTSAGFLILRPERQSHFATNELAYIISEMTSFTQKVLPGYTLIIGDVSKRGGGVLFRHKSHQNGLDADVAMYFNNKSLQRSFVSAVSGNVPHVNWMKEQQWKLFKHVVNTQLVDRIFIHGVLKKALCDLAIKNGELQKGKNQGLAYETLRRLRIDPDHADHFHLRLKCSSAQIRCRQMADPAPGSGCF